MSDDLVKAWDDGYEQGRQDNATDDRIELQKYRAIFATPDEAERAREDLIEALQDAVTEGGIWDGEWLDTAAKTSVMMNCDRLVELGAWEQHPKGYGRRWWYRPKKEPDQ